MKTKRKLISVLISVALFVCTGLGLCFNADAQGDYNNSYSLTVGDNLVTNFTVDAAGYKADGGATLEYTYNNAEGEEYTETTETVDLSSVNSSTYTFSIPQAAAQIAEPITITVKKSDSSVLDTFECSAKAYCDHFINMTPAELDGVVKGKRLQNICKSIVAYGYAAQQQFSSYMEYEGTVPITTSYATDLDINSANYTDTTGRVNTRGTRVYFKSISYFCTSTARLRFYLDTTNATEEELNAQPTASNLPTGVKVNKGFDEDKGLYFIDVNGLKPVDFDKIVTVNYCDASISMNVLHYAGMIIGSSSASISSQTKYLAKTLVVYFEKTTSYFDNNITVTFNANGGTCATSETTVQAGSSLTLPNATKAGNDFSGWYTAATGGSRIGGNGDSYSPNDNIELYAQFAPYTVTYNANGGTVSPASDTVDSSGNVTLPTPSWAGHRFDGWYTAASGGTSVGAAGASYTPSSSTTIHAHWTAHTHTISWSNSNSTTTVTLNDGNNTVSSGSTEVAYDTVVRVDLSYSESNDRSFTVVANGEDVTRYSNYACTSTTTSQDAGTYYFKMPDYNVTITSSSKSGGVCVTEDTLITLADGSQKRVDELTSNDELLVWNLETGTYDSAPSVFIYSSPKKNYNVIHLYFDDGSETKLVYEHAYFDMDKGKYVYINESNYRNYIGDRFVKSDDIQNNEWTTVTLIDSEIKVESVTPYSPVTIHHLCFYVDGLLSIPGGTTGLVNIFDVDLNTMRYDYEAMQNDIATYGQYSYEDFDDVMSYKVFVAFNVQNLKISVAKGIMTTDDIYYLTNRFSVNFEEYNNNNN